MAKILLISQRDVANKIWGYGVHDGVVQTECVLKNGVKTGMLLRISQNNLEGDRIKCILKSKSSLQLIVLQTCQF